MIRLTAHVWRLTLLFENKIELLLLLFLNIVHLHVIQRVRCALCEDVARLCTLINTKARTRHCILDAWHMPVCISHQTKHAGHL